MLSISRYNTCGSADRPLAVVAEQLIQSASSARVAQVPSSAHSGGFSRRYQQMIVGDGRVPIGSMHALYLPSLAAAFAFDEPN
jgi:hypothetical protein